MQLLIMSILPVLIIGLTLLMITVKTLEANMLSEALEGLQSACNLYREEILTTGRDLTTNELEDEYKAVTGFDFTRFEGDERASTSVKKADGARPIGTKAADSVIEAVLKGGQEFTSEKTDVAGQDYCVAYSPLKDDGGSITGMAFAGKPRASIEAGIRKSVMTVVIVGTVIILISIVAVYVIASRFVLVLNSAQGTISKLSNGEFEKAKKFSERNDELGDMIRDSNALVDSLQGIVSNIKNSADKVEKSSTELSNTASQISDNCVNVTETVQDMAKGATEQAETIQKSTENISNLSEAIQSVAENAEMLAGTAATMGDASKESADSISDLRINMDKMGEAVKEISSTMEATNAAVQSVNDKVDNITSIASQTNLLALNASIEAARAGDAGKGFAVVAEEIGKLATDSAKTAAEIRGEMQQLLEQASNATEKTAEVAEIGRNVSNVLNGTVNTVNSLIEDVGNTVDGINTISDLTEECAANKVEIVDGMASLSAISEENAASSQVTGSAMEELTATVNVLADNASDLKNVAAHLREELGFFKV